MQREPRSVAAGWPDDAARAFALGFARVYLSYEPERPAAYARAVERFVASELAASVVPQFAPRRVAAGCAGRDGRPGGARR